MVSNILVSVNAAIAYCPNNRKVVGNPGMYVGLAHTNWGRPLTGERDTCANKLFQLQC